MTESSTTDGDPGDPGDPFDAEEFARQTVQTIEQGDDYAEQLELRVTRLEEITAARWPRSLILRWRLAREIRASVAGYDDAYIPRGDFTGRRFEAAGDQVSRARADRQGERFLP